MSYPSALDNIATVSTGQLITSAYVNSQTNALNNIESTFGLNPARAICEGRLTLSTGVPVPTADVTGATTIYFTAFRGNRIALYDGTSAWNTYVFTSDLSIALGTLTNATNYDVFVYNNSGTATLELGPAWSSNTARATALVLQDGILVKSGATTRRYLGTFRTTATTTTEDSAANRFLFNVNSQVPRHLLAQNSGSPTSTSATFASVASTTASILVGYQLGALSFQALLNAAQHSVSGTTSSFGAGINGSNPTIAAYATMDEPTNNANFNLNAPVAMAYPGLGLNTVAAYAKTGAATLTMVNPAIAGWMEM